VVGELDTTAYYLNARVTGFVLVHAGAVRAIGNDFELGLPHGSNTSLLVFHHQLQQLATVLIDKVQALTRYRALLQHPQAAIL